MCVCVFCVVCNDSHLTVVHDSGNGSLLSSQGRDYHHHHHSESDDSDYDGDDDESELKMLMIMMITLIK